MTHPDPLLPVTAARAPDGSLTIAGRSVVELAARHGTPLYLYDVATLDHQLGRYRDALARHWPGEARVAYAAKAWLTLAMARWAADRGLSLDVVSEGELAHALAAGFPAARIHAHGNNKRDDYLDACLRAGVEAIVLDHPDEVARLERLCAHHGSEQGVWIRLNPGTGARTHAHIDTGRPEGKFGLGLDDGSAAEVARRVVASERLVWRGIHFHIGSQLPDTLSLREAVRRVFEWLATRPPDGRRTVEHFSPGGGWAVPYRVEDPELGPERAIPDLAAEIEASCARHALSRPELLLEPGRELVARAGVALYRVGAIKAAGRTRYALLDGGLADNPRPALYGARYSPRLAGRHGEDELEYHLAGPFCESGDVLPGVYRLPSLRPGDLIALPVSGAYQLSMASTYNGAPRPAVLWLRAGRATVIQTREQVEALWARDRLPDEEGEWTS